MKSPKHKEVLKNSFNFNIFLEYEKVIKNLEQILEKKMIELK